MPTITTAQRRARLAFRHRLTPTRRTDDVVEICDSLVAFHSSDPVSVYLSVCARQRRPSLRSVEEALYIHRTLVRHHAMRRTLWVMTPDVARLAHAATTDSYGKRERRGLVKLIESQGLAVDGETWLAQAEQQALAAVERLGPSTARRIAEHVPSLRLPLRLAAGTANEVTVAAHTRVLLILGFQGLLVRSRPLGTWLGSQYRWVLAKSWLPDGLAGGDSTRAAGDLADLYLRSFGPATVTDLAWWAGWSAATTRKALASCEAVEVALDQGTGWLPKDDPPARRRPESWAALLPALDPTVMGWKERHWYLHPALVRALFDRNGNAGPTVWVNGEVVGGWVQRPDGRIVYKLLLDRGRQAQRSVDEEVERLGELLGDRCFSVRFRSPLLDDLLA